MVRIAVCEADKLTPERDAGSRAVADLIGALRSLGHEVGVFAETSGALPREVADFAPGIVVISRPGLFARLQPVLAPLGVPLVFLAHDLHFVRLGLQHGVTGTLPDAAARVMRAVEERCFRTADLVLLPTDEEAARATREFPGARCLAIPYFAMPESAPRDHPPRGLALVFVGGHRHAPNRDGIAWFAGEVWPALNRRHPEATLEVCGDWAIPDRPEGPGIGYRVGLDDVALDRVLATARVGIAPLRFGAGMKRKTLHYLSLGLPVVGTGYAVEGLTDGTGQVPGVLRAESPDEWLAAVERLLDDRFWVETSSRGARFVAERFSAEGQRRRVAEALSGLG